MQGSFIYGAPVRTGTGNSGSLSNMLYK